MQNPDPNRPVTGIPASTNGPPPHPSTNAYPYAAYYQPNSNAYYPHRPQYDPRAAFCRRFICAALLVFLIFGTIIFIIWLVIRPAIPEFTLTTLTVSNLSLTSSQRLTGNFGVGFQAYNPNKKMTVHYEDLSSSVAYRSSLIAVTNLPPFVQPPKDQTPISGTITVVDSYVEDEVARGISDEKARGTLALNVHVVARVWFNTGAWRTRRRQLLVLCRGVPVGISSGGSGKLNGGERRCGVGI